jgi:hypothetical protein
MSNRRRKNGEVGSRGRLSEKPFVDAVRIAVSDIAADGRQKLRHIAERLVQAAMAGEGWAICQIADRLDGKPVQATESKTLNVNVNLDQYTDAELLERLARTRGARGGVASPGNVEAESAPPLVN